MRAFYWVELTAEMELQLSILAIEHSLIDAAILKALRGEK